MSRVSEESNRYITQVNRLEMFKFLIISLFDRVPLVSLVLLAELEFLVLM